MFGEYSPRLKNLRPADTSILLTYSGNAISVNPAYAFGWTSTHTFIQSGLGATTTSDGVILDNTTDATISVVQVSPATKWRARAYNTGTSSSKTVDFRAWVLPSSSTDPNGIWKIQVLHEGDTYKDLFGLDSLSGGLGVYFTPRTALSNSNPGSSRNITINNNGSNSWIDFKFSGTAKSYIGADSSGALKLYQSGGSGVEFYAVSGSLYSYNYAGAFVHSSYIQAGAGVNAGSQSQPTSTLQNWGGTALKVKNLTASGTLDNTATHWLLDATTASACTGTASSACSSYSNSSDCIARNSHGGCSWYAGSSCSSFNYEGGMSTCSGTSGCSTDTSGCYGGDQYSCESLDDSYGGSCSWSNNPQSCSGFDESTCMSYSGSGCSLNYFDCSGLNGNYSSCVGHGGCSSGGNSCSGYSSDYYGCLGVGCSPNLGNDCGSLSDGGSDGTACSSQVTCSYDSGSGVCSGTYISSCDGDNSTCSGSPFESCGGNYDSYSCNGTYNTGNCSGTYGANCSGTPSCTNISDGTDCGNESGCTYSSVLNANLPDGEQCPDRTYWIYNDSSGGADVVLYPYSGQTVNNTTSYTLSSYKNWIHIVYFKKIASCAPFSEGDCTPSGCSPSYGSCSWDYGMSICNGAGSCSSYSNDTDCNNGTYYAGCSGSYVLAKNWYKMGSG